MLIIPILVHARTDVCIFTHTMQLSYTRLLAFLLFLGFSQVLSAQSPQDVWYFGDQQGIRFENGNPVFDPLSQNRSLGGSCTMSDSAGNLLFYTNGNIFYNRNHVQMPGLPGFANLSIIDVVAMPSTEDPNIYHVYVANTQWLAQYKVDLSQNNGMGTAVHVQSYYSNGPMRALTAIKGCLPKTYWLVHIQQINTFEYSMNTLKIDGITGAATVVDRYSIGDTLTPYIWEMTTSPQGDQIALAAQNEFHVFDFDILCGKVSNQLALPVPEQDAIPYGASYSPDGNFLYASYSIGLEKFRGLLYQLDRYNLSDPDLFRNRFESDHVITGLQNGPDGRLYMVANYRNPNIATVNRLEAPNAPWPMGTYTEALFTLTKDWLHHTSFPNYMVGSPNCQAPAPVLEKDVFCAGDSIRLQVKNVLQFDSLHFINRTKNTSTFLNTPRGIAIAPNDTGSFFIEMTWNKCLIPNKAQLPINVVERPLFNVPDTVICHGDSLFLQKASNGATQRMEVWSGSAWTPFVSDSIVIDSGNYRLELRTPYCAEQKEFEVQLTKPLLTELSDQYTFCEKAGNVVMLDAGKGFQHYRWFPTDDSTQWIEVKEEGSYYVVVKDSKGCSGQGNADVASDCEPVIFIPNAFSPNGDGLNERFQIETSFTQILQVQIFDRWGALVYHANDEEKAWDGTKKGEDLPIGVYLFLVEYEDTLEGNGTKSASGTLHLIR